MLHSSSSLIIINDEYNSLVLFEESLINQFNANSNGQSLSVQLLSNKCQGDGDSQTKD